MFSRSFFSVFAFYLSIQASALASTSDLKWLNGENVCTGSWSYSRMAYCAYTDDVNSPIYETVYDEKTVVEPCRVMKAPEKAPEGDKTFYDVVETKIHELKWEDSRTAPSCGPYMPPNNNDLDIWVSKGISNIRGPSKGRCKKRDAFKTCVSWHDDFYATCTFERRVAKTIQDPAYCPTRIEREPRQVLVGYNKISGYHPSCPGATTQITPYLTPKSSITGSDVNFASIKCSTFDDVAATTPDNIKEKFDAYLNLAFELAGSEGQCSTKKPVYEALFKISENSMINVGGTDIDALTEDQRNIAFETIDLLTITCDQSESKNRFAIAHENTSKILTDVATSFKATPDAEFYMVTYYNASRDSSDQSISLSYGNRGGSRSYRFNLDGTVLVVSNGVPASAPLQPGTRELEQAMQVLKGDLAINLKTAQRTGPEQAVIYLSAFVELVSSLETYSN